MKLLLTFGKDKEEVDWYQTIQDIPRIISYKGINYEFVLYDRHHYYDWVCHFGKYSAYPGYVPTFEGLFGHTRNLRATCECGAKHTAFPQVHMFFCPLWMDVMRG